MNKLTTFFRTRLFLHGMLTKYAAENHSLQEENYKLRHKLATKDNVLQRALDDHAQPNSFNRQVISNMQKRIDELNHQIAVFNEWRVKYKNLIEFADEDPEDLSPETEQDYIDSIIERQVEEHDALEAQKG